MTEQINIDKTIKSAFDSCIEMYETRKKRGAVVWETRYNINDVKEIAKDPKQYFQTKNGSIAVAQRSVLDEASEMFSLLETIRGLRIGFPLNHTKGRDLFDYLYTYVSFHYLCKQRHQLNLANNDILELNKIIKIKSATGFDRMRSIFWKFKPAEHFAVRAIQR
jgi:hypothetical protein